MIGDYQKKRRHDMGRHHIKMSSERRMDVVRMLRAADRTQKEIAEKLHISITVVNRIAHELGIRGRRKLDRTTEPKPIPKVPQPCWDCRKACGGCSWADSRTPINGWTAEPILIDGRAWSYNITHCPEYEPDDGKINICRSGFETLAEAIVLQAVKDWRKAPGRRGEIERFFRSNWFGILTSISPDRLIEGLKKEE